MKKSVLAATILSLAAAAPALAVEGPYLGLQGGAVFLNDADYEGTGASAGTRFTAEHDTGYTVGALFGYAYGTTRGELEFSYRQNDLDDITDATVAGVGTVGSFEAAGVGVDGETNVFSVMLNGFMDFDLGGPFTPYVMAGLGAANIELEEVSVTVGGVTATAPDEDETVLAYQAGAGIAYGLGQAVSLSLEYRYFGTLEPEFSEVDGEYNSHNLIAGVRFHY